MKANPENVAKAMTETLQNEDNERVSSICTVAHKYHGKRFKSIPHN